MFNNSNSTQGKKKVNSSFFATTLHGYSWADNSHTTSPSHCQAVGQINILSHLDRGPKGEQMPKIFFESASIDANNNSHYCPFVAATGNDALQRIIQQGVSDWSF